MPLGHRLMVLNGGRIEPPGADTPVRGHLGEAG